MFRFSLISTLCKNLVTSHIARSSLQLHPPPSPTSMRRTLILRAQSARLETTLKSTSSIKNASPDRRDPESFRDAPFYKPRTPRSSSKEVQRRLQQATRQKELAKHKEYDLLQEQKSRWRSMNGGGFHMDERPERIGAALRFPRGFDIGLTFDNPSTDYIRSERKRFSYTLLNSDVPSEPFVSLGMLRKFHTDFLDNATSVLETLSKKCRPFAIEVANPLLAENKSRPSNPMLGFHLRSDDLLELRWTLLQELARIDSFIDMVSGKKVPSEQWRPGIMVGNGLDAENRFYGIMDDGGFPSRQLVATGFHVKRSLRDSKKYTDEYPGWFLPFGGRWKKPAFK